jgi:hypothetical protein
MLGALRGEEGVDEAKDGLAVGAAELLDLAEPAPGRPACGSVGAARGCP